MARGNIPRYARDVSAEGLWADALASWAIPDEILAAAPESPWGFPVELFSRRADHALTAETISIATARDALSDGGTVLDVGCGAGAASLPLAGPASLLVGVDPSRELLEAFQDRAEASGVPHLAIEGSWPEAADGTPVTDVVVCNHVVYNVAKLSAFAMRLTDHARRRVVVEMTERHPLSNEAPLWHRFHGLSRPTRPTADDAVAVLGEAGLDVRRKDWKAPSGGGFETKEKVIAHIRRRLCLPAERDHEIAGALDGLLEEREDGSVWFPTRTVVTLWWDGSA